MTYVISEPPSIRRAAPPRPGGSVSTPSLSGPSLAQMCHA